jgi:stress response protein SCP2
LDASLLCFNVSDSFIPRSHIDYNTPVNELLGESVLHSGDQINGKTGEHNILISLGKMPKVVHSVVLVLSAWTDTLSAITNPFVKLVDMKVPDVPLCEYSLEKAGNSQAVIMARITRSVAGNGWKVEPIGVTSAGTCRSYVPILATLENIKRRGAKEQ